MSVQKLSDFEPGAGGVVKRWCQELHIAGEWQREWEDQSAEIVKRYRGELAAGQSASFNVLHSNVETLRPALYGQTPQPDVRRRVDVPGDADRNAATVLERAIRYMNDSCDYDGQVNRVLNDYLLTGRGVARVRYTPTIVQRYEPLTRIEGEGTARFFTANMNEVSPEDVIDDDEGPRAQVEELSFERADVEHVAYNNFRHTPARRWADVRWCAFRHHFDYEELRQAFGKGKADNTAITAQPTNQSAVKRGDGLQPDLFSKVEVWEIWDKPTRQILFICEAHPTGPLATFDDSPEYYNLEGFFPTPGPLLSIEHPESLLPVPEFIIYQDQADELDEISSKIRNIVETIDVFGAYDGALPQLGDMFRNRQRLTAIDDWRALTDKGGIAGIMDFIPIEPQVKAFVALTENRNLLLDTIYQTVGISDIARGASDPRETATAQRLKGNFGTQRLAPRQRAVQMYLRDLMRLQGEIIAEKFDPEVLGMIAGVELDDDTLGLLTLDPMRDFLIDIETDSTIAPDQAAMREDVAEMLEGLAAFGNAAQHIPEGARMPLLQSVVRKFKLGRDVEVAIEEAAQEPPQPDPEAEAAGVDAQVKMAEVQRKAAKDSADFELKAQELALKAQELGMKREEAEADVMLALGKLFGGAGGGG